VLVGEIAWKFESSRPHHFSIAPVNGVFSIRTMFGDIADG